MQKGAPATIAGAPFQEVDYNQEGITIRSAGAYSFTKRWCVVEAPSFTVSM